MKEAIGLKINDALLLSAIKVMISLLGYEERIENASVIITDDESFSSDGTAVVLIGRREAERLDGKVFLRRPFSEKELKRTLESVITDKPCDTVVIERDKSGSGIVVLGERITLTDKEMTLFSLLYDNIGKVVSDERILNEVWKNETVQGSNIVAVYIKYLRQKIDERVGRRLIFRVRGDGYMLKINEKE